MNEQINYKQISLSSKDNFDNLMMNESEKGGTSVACVMAINLR
jgi:hypothetical protein